MIRILHTADLHLGAAFPELGEKEGKRRLDLLQTFERLLTLAIKNEVQLLIVAGDLFDDSRPASELVDQVASGLKRLIDRGIAVVLLPGDHDAPPAADGVYAKLTALGAVLLPETPGSQPVTVTVAGQPVHFYAFGGCALPSPTILDRMARRPLEGLHIGVLHGLRPVLPGESGNGLSLETLRDWSLDYLAFGHGHEFLLVEAGEHLYGCRPGSPEGLRFGENGPRHCALAEVEPERVRVEPLPVGGRVLDELSLDLTGCETLAEAATRILELHSTDLLLRLTLTGLIEVPLDMAELHDRCAGDFFHLELRDRTELLAGDFVSRMESEETVRGVLARRARRLLADSPPERRPLVEEAFRETLRRFQGQGGGRA